MARRQNVTNFWVTGSTGPSNAMGEGAQTWQANGSVIKKSRFGGVAAAAKRTGLTVAALVLLAAVLNFTTAFKPFTWVLRGAFGETAPTRANKSLPRTIGSSAPAPALARPSAATLTAPEQAAERYLTLAKAKDVHQMWASLTPDYQARQSQQAFDHWWRDEVVDFDGPYISPGAAPVADPSQPDTTWVQWAARFEESGTSQVHRGRAWLSGFSIFWLKVADVNGRYLIDGGVERRPCPPPATDLRYCAGDAHHLYAGAVAK